MVLGTNLIKNDNPTIIIENPEIYLHPEAQVKLMNFLNFCKSFCQIIIETHSEYIVKSAIQKKDKETSIFVSKKDNGYTKTSFFSSSDFKTDSYLEVIYHSFGIITSDFHILLYGYVKRQYDDKNSGTESSIKKFDEYLLSQPNVICKEWKHATSRRTTTYKTLPTFIRNKIDHPDAKNPNTNTTYEYTEEELRKSVMFLLSLL